MSGTGLYYRATRCLYECPVLCYATPTRCPVLSGYAASRSRAMWVTRLGTRRKRRVGRAGIQAPEYLSSRDRGTVRPV
eukprot:2358474-Rhodomonas_salina.11